MDPNQCLEELRARMQAFRDARDAAPAGVKDSPLGEAGEAMLEHIEILDEWMTRGGFLPRDWNKN